MSDLVVIGYDSLSKAEAARSDLFQLSREYYADIADAVIATADEKGRIRLNQMVTPWLVGTSAGSLWGLLLGLLFLHPLLGVFTGAAAGAVTGALSDFGIRDDFMREVARVLQPGQAALFVLARNVTSDRVIDQVATHGGKVLRTSLSTADERKLVAVFDKVRADAHSAPTTHAA